MAIEDIRFKAVIPQGRRSAEFGKQGAEGEGQQQPRSPAACPPIGWAAFAARTCFLDR